MTTQPPSQPPPQQRLNTAAHTYSAVLLLLLLLVDCGTPPAGLVSAVKRPCVSARDPRLVPRMASCCRWPSARAVDWRWWWGGGHESAVTGRQTNQPSRTTQGERRGGCVCLRAHHARQRQPAGNNTTAKHAALCLVRDQLVYCGIACIAICGKQLAQQSMWRGQHVVWGIKELFDVLPLASPASGCTGPWDNRACRPRCSSARCNSAPGWALASPSCAVMLGQSRHNLGQTPLEAAARRAAGAAAGPRRAPAEQP